VLGVVRDISERVDAYALLEQRVQERTGELSTRMRELEGLYRADAILYRSLHLDEVLQALVNVVTDILQADKCAVSVWDEQRQRLVARATRGFRPETVRHMVYAPGHGIAGHVFVQGEPIAVEDTRSDARVIHAINDPEGIHSVLMVPISISGRVFGVFGVNYCRQRTFSVDEIRLFQALAQRAALAIENARLYEQAQQAAALAERQRLARELHDSVTQSLYSLTLLAEAGRRLVTAGDLAPVAGYFSRLGETAQQALKEMRLLMYELRPLGLEGDGLITALQQRLNAVEQRAGVQACLVGEGAVELGAAVEHELYQIVVEALNNALKHAGATAVTVRLAATADGVELEIADNGRGFDLEAVREQGGMGLVGMRERVARLGGDLRIDSTTGAGTTIRVSLR
jgi:signal transduction histidine kinase